MAGAIIAISDGLYWLDPTVTLAIALASVTTSSAC
jgi:hypothetical protein